MNGYDLHGLLPDGTTKCCCFTDVTGLSIESKIPRNPETILFLFLTLFLNVMINFIS